MTVKVVRIDLNPCLKTRTLYIFLVRTNSLFSNIISLFTRAHYTHASIGLDPDCRDLYSFARIYTSTPIPAGFVHESRQSGLLSLSPNAPCRVYRVRVTEQAYEDVKNQLMYMYRHREKFHYNYLGPIFCFFGLPIRLKNKYFCSQFVAETLARHRIVTLSKPASLYHPRDIAKLEELELIFDDRLSELCNLNVEEPEEANRSRTAGSDAHVRHFGRHDLLGLLRRAIR